MALAECELERKRRIDFIHRTFVSLGIEELNEELNSSSAAHKQQSKQRKKQEKHQPAEPLRRSSRVKVNPMPDYVEDEGDTRPAADDVDYGSEAASDDDDDDDAGDDADHNVLKRLLRRSLGNLYSSDQAGLDDAVLNAANFMVANGFTLQNLITRAVTVPVTHAVWDRIQEHRIRTSDLPRVQALCANYGRGG